MVIPASLTPETVIIITAVSAIGLVLSMAAMGIAYLRVRHAKDALDESERRYRAVVEDQTELICRFRPDGTLLFVNDAFCRFFSHDAADLIGTRFIPSTDRAERHKVRNHLMGLTRLRPVGSMTSRVETKNSGQRWIRWNDRAIFDENGNVSEFLAVGMDMTEVMIAEEKLRIYHENLEELVHTRTRELEETNTTLKQEIAERTHAENMLAAEKERLAVTLRSIGDGVITTDIRGRVLMLNKAAEDLTGLRHEQAFMRPLADVFNIVDEQTRQPFALTRPDGMMVKDGQPSRTVRGILVPEGGRELLVEQSAASITDHDNRVIGSVIVFRDMTERQKLEQELIHTQNLESLGLLAGGIAHDFNNILTAIFGNVMLAKNHQDAGSEPFDRLSEAEQAIGRARELTHQLLTFSKGGSPVKETADISAIVADSTRFMLRGSKTRPEFAISPSVWAVDVDIGQMSQVINNIVLNADYAMPDGGVLHVTVENARVTGDLHLPVPDGRYVRISLVDEGAGIPRESLDRIFDPYFTTKPGGSGLGLSTARSIVRRHNGLITVASEPGNGTEVHIWLPASEKSLPEKTATPDPSRNLSGEGRVLVMDDEETIRDVAKALLEHLGYHVDVAKDGDEAIALYQAAQREENPYHCVIMDLTIPGGMGGREAIERLLAIDPGTRAIVSSGYSNDPVMADHRKFGFLGILAKPYTMAEMGRAVSQLNGPHPDRA